MALTGAAIVGTGAQGSTVKTFYVDRVQFDLDNSYPTGGYTDFTDFLKTVIGTRKTPIAILPDGNANGGYSLIWDRINDTLLAYEGAAGLGPNTEVVNGTDLSAIANVEMVVISI